jgi:hypothetical protein
MILAEGYARPASSHYARGLYLPGRHEFGRREFRIITIEHNEASA